MMCLQLVYLHFGSQEDWWLLYIWPASKTSINIPGIVHDLMCLHFHVSFSLLVQVMPQQLFSLEEQLICVSLDIFMPLVNSPCCWLVDIRLLPNTSPLFCHCLLVSLFQVSVHSSSSCSSLSPRCCCIILGSWRRMGGGILVIVRAQKRGSWLSHFILGVHAALARGKHHYWNTLSIQPVPPPCTNYLHLLSLPTYWPCEIMMPGQNTITKNLVLIRYAKGKEEQY